MSAAERRVGSGTDRMAFFTDRCSRAIEYTAGMWTMCARTLGHDGPCRPAPLRRSSALPSLSAGTDETENT